MLAILLLLAASAFAQPDRFGLPECAGPDAELLTRTGFVICHSGLLRTPLWAAHVVYRDRAGTVTPRPRHFRRDWELKQPGAADSDYRNSGWARGHLVPAQDLAGDEQAVRASFLLSNAVPQDPSLNSGKWRALENAVRRLARKADFVVVFTGPIFCGEPSVRIGINRVAVPCALFKVVLHGSDPIAAEAYIMPNDRNPDEPFSAFGASLTEVGHRTGLRFFASLTSAVGQPRSGPAE